MSDDQLIYNSLLRNASHPFTIELSNEATFGIDQALRGSHLAPRYHAATITKFMDTKETVMPASVGNMVGAAGMPVMVVWYCFSWGGVWLRSFQIYISECLCFP